MRTVGTKLVGLAVTSLLVAGPAFAASAGLGGCQKTDTRTSQEALPDVAEGAFIRRVPPPDLLRSLAPSGSRYSGSRRVATHRGNNVVSGRTR